jgi:hypothetical protein
MLPLAISRTRDMDARLVEGLLNGRTSAADPGRIGEVFQVMKRHLLLHQLRIPSMVLRFWTPSELQALLTTFKNVGFSILQPPNPIHAMHAMTTLLSKTPQQVVDLARHFVAVMQSRSSDNTDALVVPECFAQLQCAPLGCRDLLTIVGPEVTNVIKRVLLNSFVRRALTALRENQEDLDKVLPGGQQWWSVRHSILLFELLIQLGFDSFSAILVSPQFPFSEHLTEDDRKYLTTFQKGLLSAETSKLPQFLQNEGKLYSWLRMLAGQPRLQPPVPQPFRTVPPPAPHVQNLVGRQFLPVQVQAVPQPSARPATTLPPPTRLTRPAHVRTAPVAERPPPRDARARMATPPPLPFPVLDGPPRVVEAPAPPKRDVVTKRRTLAFTVPEPPEVVFHAGNVDVIEQRLSQARKKKLKKKWN